MLGVDAGKGVIGRWVGGVNMRGDEKDARGGDEVGEWGNGCVGTEAASGGRMIPGRGCENVASGVARAWGMGMEV